MMLDDALDRLEDAQRSASCFRLRRDSGINLPEIVLLFLHIPLHVAGGVVLYRCF